MRRRPSEEVVELSFERGPGVRARHDHAVDREGRRSADPRTPPVLLRLFGKPCGGRLVGQAAIELGAVVAAQSDKDWKRPGIDSTPSFTINGIVMPGTHTWPALQQQLNDFL